MAVDLSRAFSEKLARNRGLIPGRPDALRPAAYGVHAVIEGAEVALTLTFLAGVAYCCMEWSCHLSFSSQQHWNWLRQELSRTSRAPADQLSMRLTVVVEPGAMFFDLSRPRSDLQHGWYDFAPQAVDFTYQVSILEPGDTA